MYIYKYNCIYIWSHIFIYIYACIYIYVYTRALHPGHWIGIWVGSARLVRNIPRFGWDGSIDLNFVDYPKRPDHPVRPVEKNKARKKTSTNPQRTVRENLKKGFGRNHIEPLLEPQRNPQAYPSAVSQRPTATMTRSAEYIHKRDSIKVQTANIHGHIGMENKQKHPKLRSSAFSHSSHGEPQITP